ncbi:basic amino acid ABC transporter substrate-binding protein [Pseudonocardia sp. WMMC193]|uniref:basic amino acid ABC transporter substrate-binding protein n=1 Tax=Pseudonocardia sp. WMMC193 TaxID=2911965 RepID=UPI001F1723BC|nr:basic amino acid ABC transporter substrate-binding protein [Pseudonocardia sp. WMMC193]MCF7552012.1 basic amino acid ABC transporter substrate-binding protein [Pseudonocardia sp. WMMC193]
MRARSFLLPLTAAAMAAVLAGCGGGGAAEAPGGVQLVQQGSLTMCTQLPYDPFEFRQGNDIVGFDVDMVNLVSAKLGVTTQIIDTPFDTIQSGADLDTGKCDIGAAAMTITDARKQNIDFSDPYFDATQALLVKADAGITDLGQLAGKRLGVQNSTTGADYATANAAGAEIVTFEDLGLLLTAVQTGNVDAAINDNGPLLDFAKKNPGLTVTKEFDTGEQYGFGIRKGNTALTQAVNEALAAAKSDGTYNRIYTTWFGQAPATGS